MMTITNQKVAGWMPIWAKFHGFSLLFDNPGTSFSPLKVRPVFQQIACKRSEPALDFYHSLSDALQASEQIVSTYLLCLLPPSSYHVTVCDGLNDGNTSDVAPQCRLNADDFIRTLPESLDTLSDFTCDPQGTPLHIDMNAPLTFAFAGLRKWGNSSLVATLQPANTHAQKELEHIVHARAGLLRAYQERFALCTANMDYLPHVSLGYFANQEHAELATPQIDRWEEHFRQQTAGKTITFSSISLYGFIDMATFFRRTSQNAK